MKKIRIIIYCLCLFMVLAMIPAMLLRPNEPSDNGMTMTFENERCRINFGQIFQPHEPMEFLVPLEKLGLMVGSVEKITSTCACTVGDVEPTDDHITLLYDPGKSSGGVINQSLGVYHKGDPQNPRYINIQGHIIKSWLPKPLKMRIPALRAGAREDFSCTLARNYEEDNLKLISYALEPENDQITVKASLSSDTKSILVEGSVTGTLLPEKYSGKVILEFNQGAVTHMEVPVEIKHLGSLIISPPTVTLFKSNNKTVTVSLRHVNDESLLLEKIECPKHLTASVISDSPDDLLQIKVSLAPHINEMLNKKLTTESIKLTFKNLRQVGLVRTIVLP